MGVPLQVDDKAFGAIVVQIKTHFK
jgi:hypothetical protein